MTTFTRAFHLASVTIAAAGLLALGGCGGRNNEAYDSARADTMQSNLEARWLNGVSLPALMDCTREQNATLIQAHRTGPRPGYPENALSTMLAALNDGALFLEMDVRQTRDGVLVLMHDETVDSTTNGQGAVAEMSLAEFTRLSLEDDTGRIIEEAPPTLDAALAALDGIGFAQLDLKGIDYRDMVAAVNARNAMDRVIVITYSPAQAIALSRAAPDIMMSVGINSLDELDALQSAGVDLTRVQAWLGLGQGNPALDEALASRDIETSFGDFRAEADGRADYLAMADAGAEVISVDNVPQASHVLRAAQQARGVLAVCPAARRPG